MDLGEAVYQAITGGVPSSAEPQGFRDALQVMASSSGSTSALARSLGVARSTLRGWFGGRTPRSDTSGITHAGVMAWRRSILSADREDRLRGPWSLDDMVVTGTFNYSGGGTMRGAEDRSVRLGDYLHDVADDLVDAYLDGAGTHELGAILHGAIGDHGFYAETFDPDNPDGGWDITSIDGWGD